MPFTTRSHGLEQRRATALGGQAHPARRAAAAPCEADQQPAALCHLEFDAVEHRALRQRAHGLSQVVAVVIFVVDASDADRAPLAAEEIDKLAQEDALRESLLLIYLNKQDLPNAMSNAEAAKQLQLQKLTAQGRKWFAQPAIERTGDGLFEGLKWLSSELRSRP